MPQIRSIQILRAAAALSVAFGHLQSESLSMPAAAATNFKPILLDLTGAGVDLFFIISGFVMVYASRDLFESATGGRTFLRRRIARIVPLYWLTTTVFLLTMLLLPHALSSAPPTSLEIVKSYFFIPYAHPGAKDILPIYKLGWTLNYEMFFYVVFAVLIFLPMHRALSAIAALFLALVAMGALFSPSAGPFAFWTHPIILEFVMGAFLALMFLAGRRLSSWQALLLLLCGLAGFAATTISGFDAHGAWRPLLWGLPAVLIVAAAVLRDAAHGSKPVLFGFFVLLGDASYALYLLHPLVIRALRLMWDRLGLSQAASPWLFVGLALLLIVPAAILVHLVFERPMTRHIQRLLTPPAPAASTAAQT
ncbi:MAG: acyltransferase [Pseudomonadota bacterium]